MDLELSNYLAQEVGVLFIRNASANLGGYMLQFAYFNGADNSLFTRNSPGASDGAPSGGLYNQILLNSGILVQIYVIPYL